VGNLSSCLICNSGDLREVIDLGLQPARTNAFSPFPDTGADRESLRVNRCPSCFHSQLAVTVSPEKLFSEYLYVSGTTETLRKHFGDLVSFAEREGLLSSAFDRVLDIASNDGSLIEAFSAGGYTNVFGCEPAENLRELSRAKGHSVFPMYWKDVNSFVLGMKFRLITVLNCLAHVPDPKSFLRGCKRVLAPEGRILLEFPLFSNTLVSRDFGQIYFEHISYFTSYSFLRLCEEVGLAVEKFSYFPDIHGGTGRFVLSSKEDPLAPSGINSRILFEMGNGVYGEERYTSFREEVQKNISELRSVVSSSELPVFFYGASAKCTTLLNSPYDTPWDKWVEGVIDDAPLKQGRYVPGTLIPVYSLEQVQNMVVDEDWEEKDLTVVCGAHNFKTEILQRLRTAGVTGKLVSYVPEVTVEEI
jgi:SAM-dependent methyltransferase